MLEEQAASVHRLINAYIRYLRDKKATNSTVIREELAAYDAGEDDDNEPF
jgi:hypothetical protein